MNHLCLFFYSTGSTDPTESKVSLLTETKQKSLKNNWHFLSMPTIERGGSLSTMLPLLHDIAVWLWYAISAYYSDGPSCRFVEHNKALFLVGDEVT